ncbi:MAG: enoyl-CoA hydratase/isomerase family protein [Hyphomicrobiales bacterium]|nr:enoyl-CoA hydratase/isomerase family protein [Hyphomicrobiales bacterium]
MSGEISARVKSGIATLTLATPARLNAISLPMWQSLPGLVARAEADADVRVIALTGAGHKAFSAGADIARFGEERHDTASARLYDEAVDAAESALTAAQKPTVALINGLCFGGGMGLALACDFRLAAASAQFRLPPARLGIGYAFAGVERLVAAIGAAAAAHVLFTAMPFDAGQALTWGLVQQIIPEAEFAAASHVLLQSIADNAPLSLLAAKAALRELARPGRDHDTSLVEAAVARCYESDDYREGRAAFAEKRKPVFTGR